MKRYIRASLLVVSLASGFAACGGSPTNPAPPPPPPPQTNEAPVVESIEVSATRAEVDTEVTLTATVRDAETPLEQLKYEWSAEGGTFTGEGRTVTWRTPKDGSTPKDHTVTLTVVETYGTAPAGGTRPEHRVSATSPTVRLHDSIRELGQMGVAFLQKFGDSSVSPPVCVEDFSDSCGRNKAEELEQIEWNRKHFLILSSSLDNPRVNYVAGRNNAEVLIRATFTSRVIDCNGWPYGGTCVLNRTETAQFEGFMPSVYEQGRWWLCDSRANPVGLVPPMMRYFFGPIVPQ